MSSTIEKENKETSKQENTQGESKKHYRKDNVFKNSMIDDGEAAILLRGGIIEGVTGRFPLHTVVVNSEQVPNTIDGKKTIQDVLLFEVDTHTLYDLEMQNSRNLLRDQKRYRVYGIRLISSRYKAGTSYLKVHKLIQIIFVNDYPRPGDDMIDVYTVQNQHGRVMQIPSQITTIYIYLKQIDVIVKEKGIENLTIFEKLCYEYLYEGLGVTMKEEGKLVTAMKEQYQVMIENSDVWPFVLTAEEQEESRIESLKLEREEGEGVGLKKGMEKGKKEGIKEGERKSHVRLLTNQIKQKYGSNQESWVKTLANEQLNALSLSILTSDTLQELKKKITYKS